MIPQISFTYVLQKFPKPGELYPKNENNIIHDLKSLLHHA